MTKAELQDTLNREYFDPAHYSLDGGERDDTVCLAYERDKWYVYYTERGLQSGKVEFDTEDEACRYFLKEVRSDPMMRLGWTSKYILPPFKKPEDWK
jgi:hypothetical protein